MLVALPIGLWVFALVCDLLGTAGGDGKWNTVALYCVAAGIVGAAIAAVPGLIDYFSISDPATKRIATFHLLVNSGALILFGINLWCRFALPPGSFMPLILSVIGVAGISVGGWLGGELVYIKGMAVDALEHQGPDERPQLRRAS